MLARWIRLGSLGQRQFDASCTALAALQSRTAVPILLWGEDAARYLFALIARLKARGVSIIYISHFLEEVQRLADRYTVLRDGQSRLQRQAG